MNDECAQKLSALMDGELASAEAGPVIGQTGLSPELRAKWGRYHLIGEAIRGRLPEHVPADLAARVSAAVASEPPVLAPRRAAQRLLKPVAGFAIAASVALLAVVAVQRPVTPKGGADVPQVALAPAVDAAGTANLQPVQWYPVQTPDANSAARSRMDDYLLNYSERRANWGAPGMLPYVKVVGYENDQ